MDLTLFLTQVIGVYMLLGGIAMFLHPDRMRRATEEITKSYILPYFDGALAFILGLVIVLNHNVWEGLNATIVTAVGWLGILEGLAMFLLPQSTLSSIAKTFSSKQMMNTLGGVALVVGAYLTYVGFFA